MPKDAILAVFVSISDSAVVSLVSKAGIVTVLIVLILTWFAEANVLAVFNCVSNAVNSSIIDALFSK